MTKLHEILAVEQDLAKTANEVARGTEKTLSAKRGVFEGQLKVHQRFSDEEQHLVQAPEYKAVAATVTGNLEFLFNHLTNYWDVLLQKELANQDARADVIVNGVLLVSAVPATALLQMEKKLQALMPILVAAPTLDVAKAWEPAVDKGEHVFQTSHPEERFQTVSKTEYKTVAPATDKHPAQIREIPETQNVGKFVVTGFSGCLSSEAKAEMIERLSQLIRAVKQARMRANQVDINTEDAWGKILLDHVLYG